MRLAFDFSPRMICCPIHPQPHRGGVGYHEPGNWCAGCPRCLAFGHLGYHEKHVLSQRSLAQRLQKRDAVKLKPVFGIVRNLAHYGFRVDDLSAQLRGASRFWQLRGEAGSLLNFRNRKLAGFIGRLSG